jgi:hypothetical protein
MNVVFKQQMNQAALGIDLSVLLHHQQSEQAIRN